MFHNLVFRMYSKQMSGWGPLSIEVSSIPTLSLETFPRRKSFISFLEAASSISGITLKLNLPANLKTLSIRRGSSLNVT